MCCEHSTEIVPIPNFLMPEKENRTVGLDPCIVVQIKALWDAGFYTLGCCCGHLESGPSVILDGGCIESDFIKAYKVLYRAEDQGREWRILQWRLVEC